MLLLGKPFPDFTAETTEGVINFHEWLGDSWGILFSHPADFTPVCTTELTRVLKLMPEFTQRNVKVIALSCDPIESHLQWIKDIKSYASYLKPGFPYPIIQDSDKKLSIKFGMLDFDELDSKGTPLSARAVFIIDPSKKFRLSLLYPATTGRNFDEILRVIDSMQLTDRAQVATPADWKKGQDCMVLPTIPREKLRDLFPFSTKIALPSGKDYLIQTPCPK